MPPYNTQYFKEYKGPSSHEEVRRDFFDLTKKIDSLGISLRPPKTSPLFEKQGENRVAEEVVLLAYEMPLAEVYLRATQWSEKSEGQKVASLSINIRHFKGENPSFSGIEEIISQFNLTSRGTSLAQS